MVKEKTKKDDGGEIVVTRMEEGIISLVLLGRTPLIINRLSEKAKHELLFPALKKTSAEKAANLKHDPVAEFRSSVHRIADVNAPTLLAMPATAPKKAMASAALDIPGARKAQIGRLTYIPGELVGVFGIPYLFTEPVRNSDMNHTPDMRTRCIVPHWAMLLKVHFVRPTLNPTVVINLLAAAGLYIGIGDWRNEKGSGSYGQFDVLTVEGAEQDEQAALCFKQGRALQEQGMLDAEPYNDQTRELMSWYDMAIKTRGKTKTTVETAVAV